jgi:hypothetical protein
MRRRTIHAEACFTMKQVPCHLSLLQECDIVDSLRKILHSLTCTSPNMNMNTWSNCRSEVKTNEMPSSNFCGCTSGFRKSAHVLNKPIGSCYLKYAGTWGRFYYYIYLLVGPTLVHSKAWLLKVKTQQNSNWPKPRF